MREWVPGSSLEGKESIFKILPQIHLIIFAKLENSVALFNFSFDSEDRRVGIHH